MSQQCLTSPLENAGTKDDKCSMETTIVYEGYIRIMEKKMETTKSYTESTGFTRPAQTGRSFRGCTKRVSDLSFWPCERGTPCPSTSLAPDHVEKTLNPKP